LHPKKFRPILSAVLPAPKQTILQNQRRYEFLAAAHATFGAAAV
jgi:hypothetical protein